MSMLAPVEGAAIVVIESRTAAKLVVARHYPRMQLLIHEWEALIDDMRIGASPFAERVEHMLERFQADITQDEAEE